MKETPPLTRGRLLFGSTGRQRYRNTPAYAGKTGLRPKRPRRVWKHPRLRGEDWGWRGPSGGRVETPPLTRGRPRDKGNQHADLWKHPRLRGEDVSHVIAVTCGEETPPLTRGRQEEFGVVGQALETPPLTRGRLTPDVQMFRLEGNTPAYAGKTFLRRRKRHA